MGKFYSKKRADQVVAENQDRVKRHSELGGRLLDVLENAGYEGSTMNELRANNALIKGDVDDAIQRYSKLIEEDPNNEAYSIGLFAAYQQNGREEEALMEYQRFSALTQPSDHYIEVLQEYIEKHRKP